MNTPVEMTNTYIEPSRVDNLVYNDSEKYLTETQQSGETRRTWEISLAERRWLRALHRELAAHARSSWHAWARGFALAARNEEKLESVLQEILTAGGQGKTFVLDLASEDSIQAAAKAILAHFGKVDILINNAGITKDNLLLRMKRADWDQVLAVNLTGAFLLTQALLNPMLRARWGRIINITSVVGQTGQAGQANYSASKAGLIGFTRSMARELASRSITVNAVAPGYIETAMTAVLDEKQRQAMLAHIPLARPGNRSRRSSCGVLPSFRRS